MARMALAFDLLKLMDWYDWKSLLVGVNVLSAKWFIRYGLAKVIYAMFPVAILKCLMTLISDVAASQRDLRLLRILLLQQKMLQVSRPKENAHSHPKQLV